MRKNNKTFFQKIKFLINVYEFVSINKIKAIINNKLGFIKRFKFIIIKKTTNNNKKNYFFSTIIICIIICIFFFFFLFIIKSEKCIEIIQNYSAIFFFFFPFIYLFSKKIIYTTKLEAFFKSKTYQAYKKTFLEKKQFSNNLKYLTNTKQIYSTLHTILEPSVDEALVYNDIV